MTGPSFDRRVTPARPDLVAAALRDRIDSPRYAEPRRAYITWPVADLRPRPDAAASLDTQLLYGEQVDVYDVEGGWAWLQAAEDRYVGYCDARAFAWGAETATHRVTALSAPLHPSPDLKSPVQAALPMNALIHLVAHERRYHQLSDGRWIAEQHFAPISHLVHDWVATAERFFGVPYVWGGTTVAGIDCSGLIQAALRRAGIACPRDTDMQERELGEYRMQEDGSVPPFGRGDLLFWRGHVGVMLDAERLLHANAHHMSVAIEPVDEAIARIATAGAPLKAVKRLQT